jgi:hypothetical protein
VIVVVGELIVTLLLVVCLLSISGADSLLDVCIEGFGVLGVLFEVNGTQFDATRGRRTWLRRARLAFLGPIMVPVSQRHSDLESVLDLATIPNIAFGGALSPTLNVLVLCKLKDLLPIDVEARVGFLNAIDVGFPDLPGLFEVQWWVV